MTHRIQYILGKVLFWVPPITIPWYVGTSIEIGWYTTVVFVILLFGKIRLLPKYEHYIFVDYLAKKAREGDQTCFACLNEFGDLLEEITRIRTDPEMSKPLRSFLLKSCRVRYNDYCQKTLNMIFGRS